MDDSRLTELKRDTIAAIATGAGRAGVGIIRVSGPAAPDIARAVLGFVPTPREAVYLPFKASDGEPIDRGIALLFRAPASFTGEDVLELQGHGGAVVLRMLLQRVTDCGARLAKPGEFTERAFLNDKLDLAQAEAVADLIDSASSTAARAAMRSLEGAFSRDVAQLAEALVELRVWIEAALDFSEEDIDFLADEDLNRRTGRLVEQFESLLRRVAAGRRLREGQTVVIAGRPNAGKSSLLNALAGADTAIVTPVPGTTRDILREQIEIDGLAVELVDTAGLRDSTDVVEKVGIERARRALSSADHILLVIDATLLKAGAAVDTDSWRAELTGEAVPAAVCWTLVLNKVDCLSPGRCKALVDELQCTGQVVLACSATADIGLEALRTRIKAQSGHEQFVENAYIARQRHLLAIERAHRAAIRALDRIHEGRYVELAAEDLRLAQQALDEVVGRFDTEDLLGRIFGEFCIGK